MLHHVSPFRTRYYFSSAFKMFGAYPLQYIGLMLIAVLSGVVFTAVPITSRVYSYLIVQPLISGIYAFAFNQANGETPLFMDFFGAFNKKKYLQVVAISFLSAMIFMGFIATAAYIVFSDDFNTVIHLREILMDKSKQGPEEMQLLSNFISDHVIDLITIMGLAILSFIPIYFISGYAGISILSTSKGLGEALKDSIRVARIIPFKILGFILLSYVIIGIGFLLCGIGAVIAFPIVNIAFVNAFIDLQSISSHESKTL